MGPPLLTLPSNPSPLHATGDGVLPPVPPSILCLPGAPLRAGGSWPLLRPLTLAHLRIFIASRSPRQRRRRTRAGEGVCRRFRRVRFKSGSDSTARGTGCRGEASSACCELSGFVTRLVHTAGVPLQPPSLHRAPGPRLPQEEREGLHHRRYVASPLVPHIQPPLSNLASRRASHGIDTPGPPDGTPTHLPTPTAEIGKSVV